MAARFAEGLAASFQASMRRAAGLPPRQPWWRRQSGTRRMEEHKLQARLGLNLWIAAVVVPGVIGYYAATRNTKVAEHHERLGERRAQAAEDLLVQAIVNDRREAEDMPRVDTEATVLLQQSPLAKGDMATPESRQLDRLFREGLARDEPVPRHGRNWPRGAGSAHGEAPATQ